VLDQLLLNAGAYDQSGIEHEPGPRGSPQLPHTPDGMLELDVPFADTAKTESCGASLLLLHLGQEAASSPKTRASKG
jgi:hypothetical protein